MEHSKRTYKGIKQVLRNNIKSGVKVLWTWNKETNHFTQIYKDYSDGLTIYTPTQLLNTLNESKD